MHRMTLDTRGDVKMNGDLLWEIDKHGDESLDASRLDELHAISFKMSNKEYPPVKQGTTQTDEEKVREAEDYDRIVADPR